MSRLFTLLRLLWVLAPAASYATGQTHSDSYALQYPVQWGNLDKVLVNADGTVRNPASSGFWDAGALSANRLPAGTNGAVEFVASTPSSNAYIIGLARYNDVASFTTIDYSFYIQADGFVTIRESSTNVGFQQAYTAGTVLKIAREGTSIVYSINGVPIRTVLNVNASIELFADIAIKTGVAPVVTASFNTTSRTFYSISSGAWTTAATWSLTENGAPALQAPSHGDYVLVKGHAINITTGIFCQSLGVTAINSQTNVTINGSGAVLTVREAIKVKGLNNTAPVNAFLVQNSGSLLVQN